MDEYKKDEIHAFIDMAFQIKNDTPSVNKFFGLMEQLAMNESELKTPADYFRYGTILGMAKAMHDINKGYINITTIQIDKGDMHEDIKEPDNPLTRRNRSAQDEQGNEVAGE